MKAKRLWQIATVGMYLAAVGMFISGISAGEVFPFVLAAVFFCCGSAYLIIGRRAGKAGKPQGKAKQGEKNAETEEKK